MNEGKKIEKEIGKMKYREKGEIRQKRFDILKWDEGKIVGIE